ncbi:MAG: hypothetical protein HYS13_26260, partial [Planctomycetia bacterium]|nr:hypothetical protein [Planctomycetia bacterium]
FRTANEYWTVSNKLDEMQGVYCGPGLWLDKETGRVHVRLSHLHLKVLGGANYRGQTDPRRIPLVVAGPLTPLVIDNARHLRLQDLVVRGSAVATVQIIESESVALENVTIYGGTPALAIRATAGLKLLDCAVRGLSAPWSSRASHKYRGCLPYLVIIEGRLPQCRDFEFAGCEFTDNHDGLIIGTMQKLRFHHNLVDNFDDDGLYLTLSRPVPPADIHVYQNVLSRTHTMFSFAQSGEPASNEVGPGVFICRNVIDFRRRTMSQPPSSADSDASTTLADHSREGRPASDHGSPKWEPMFVYHNTVISEGPAFRNYYGAGWGGHTRATTRRIFNNIFVQADGLPGLAFGPAEDDIQADGNLHWSYLAGPSHAGDFFTKYRASKAFADSKARYAPGWAATDIFADPKFTAFSSDPAEPLDLRLSKGSPAVDAGVATPAEWPDPLRSADEGKPDLGALPAGSAMLRVGPGTSK